MPVSFTFLFLPSSISVTSYFSLIYFWHSRLTHFSQGKRKREGRRTAVTIFLLHLNPEIGCLRDEVISVAALKPIRAADLCLQCLSHSDFGVLRLWDWKCSGYTSLFSLTRCSTDITTTASLEQEKYPGNSKLKYYNYFISTWCCCGRRKTQKWTEHLRNYTQQHVFYFDLKLLVNIQKHKKSMRLNYATNVIPAALICSCLVIDRCHAAWGVSPIKRPL